MKRILLLLSLICFLSVNVFGQAIPKQFDYQGVLRTTAGGIVPDGNYPMTFRIYNDPTGGTALWTETQTVAVANGIFSVHLGSSTPIAGVPFNRIHFLGITLGAEPELLPRTMLTPAPYSFMSMDIMDEAVTTTKIHDGAVTGAKIGANQVVKSINGLKDDVTFLAGTNITLTPSGNNITINAAGGGGGTVTQVNTGAGLTGGPITTTGTISIPNDGVTNAMLQSNSVTSAKITDGTLVTADLGDNSVTSVKILDGTLVTDDLGDNSVTSAKIVDGTIAAADLASNSVTSAKITDGTIATADLGDNSVTSAKIVDGTVVAADLASNSVTTVKIADNNVTAAKIADEPGLAASNYIGGITLGTGSMMDVLTLTITIPTSGYIVLFGKCFLQFTGVTTQNSALVQIDETSGGTWTAPYYQYLGNDAYPNATGYYRFAANLTRIFYKTAGSYTFRIEGMAYNSSPADVRVWYPMLQAIFLPSSYGTVSTVMSGGGLTGFNNVIPLDSNEIQNPPNQSNTDRLYNVDLRDLEDINK